MSSPDQALVRAAGSWLASAGGASALLIALGWLPWRRLGGAGGTEALLVGVAVAFLGALAGALPVLQAIATPGARSGPVVTAWSTGARMAATVVLALVAVLGSELPRRALMIAVGFGYVVLLVVETKWTLRWLSASEVKSAK